MRQSRNRLRSVIGLVAVLAIFGVACVPSVDWAVGGDARPSYCDPTDTAVNDGHTGGDGSHVYPYTEPKGPLSWQNCLSVSFYVERAADYAALFPTKAVAEANGWDWIAPYIPGQGTHHVNPSGIPTTFDPLNPTMLMFDGNSGNSDLGGMVWAVNQPAGSHPPAGFPGDNDHWHNHQSLCFNSSGFVIGDSISPSACASRGGTWVDTSGLWLLHVWLPEYAGWEPTDLFNKNHPDL